MPDYSKSIIYKLCCKDTNITDIYIGSTCNFTRRKNAHKSACLNSNDKKHNLNVYKFIRENGGWLNWSMILVEEFSCENKLQKEKKEREYIENLRPSLNTKIPTRTNKEYYQDNKFKIKRKNMKNKHHYNFIKEKLIY